jgi:hypothetical protein
VFLQCSWMGLFGTKWAFNYLDNHDVQEVLFSKTNLYLKRKECARYSCF